MGLKDGVQCGVGGSQVRGQQGWAPQVQYLDMAQNTTGLGQIQVLEAEQVGQERW